MFSYCIWSKFNHLSLDDAAPTFAPSLTVLIICADFAFGTFWSAWIRVIVSLLRLYSFCPCAFGPLRVVYILLPSVSLLTMDSVRLARTMDGDARAMLLLLLLSSSLPLLLPLLSLSVSTSTSTSTSASTSTSRPFPPLSCGSKCNLDTLNLNNIKFPLAYAGLRNCNLCERVSSQNGPLGRLELPWQSSRVTCPCRLGTLIGVKKRGQK